MRWSRLLPTLTACSLAFCLLLLLAWPLSYWRAVEVRHRSGESGRVVVGLALIRGHLEVERWQFAARGDAGWSVGVYPPADSALAAEYAGRSVHGFGAVSLLEAYVEAAWGPLWLPIVLTAIAPALWLRCRRKMQVRGFVVQAVRA